MSKCSCTEQESKVTASGYETKPTNVKTGRVLKFLVQGRMCPTIWSI